MTSRRPGGDAAPAKPKKERADGSRRHRRTAADAADRTEIAAILRAAGCGAAADAATADVETETGLRSAELACTRNCARAVAALKAARTIDADGRKAAETAVMNIGYYGEVSLFWLDRFGRKDLIVGFWHDGSISVMKDWADAGPGTECELTLRLTIDALLSMCRGADIIYKLALPPPEVWNRDRGNAATGDPDGMLKTP